MIKFVNDPLPIICNIVLEIKPDIECDIQYRPDIDSAGCTTFPDDGERILIDINSEIPFSAVAEILAHELAHVIVGRSGGDEHGEKWENVFNEIFDRYEAAISKNEATST